MRFFLFLSSNKINSFLEDILSFTQRLIFFFLQGPVHAYVAVPGGKTCYLSELRTGREVLVVDQKGNQRTAVVGRVKIEKRPLILVEAKVNKLLICIFLCGLVRFIALQLSAEEEEEEEEETCLSIILQNAETVALVTPRQGSLS